MQYPDYEPRIDAPALDDTELEALDTLLQSLPGEQVMNIEALDGYLTALLLGPRLATRIPAARWLPAAWGGDGEGCAPFASQKQRKRAAVLVLRHLRSIDRALEGPAEAWEPIFSIAESDTSELVDAEDWCVGFLQGVALDAESWGPLWDDALLAPVALLGQDEADLTPAELQRLADPEQRDALSREVAQAIATFNARDRPATAAR